MATEEQQVDPGATAREASQGTSNNRARRWLYAIGVVAVLLGTQAVTQASAQAAEQVTPAAAAALPGAVVRSEQTLFDSEGPKTAMARCPEGKRVTGGGGRVDGFASHVVITRLQPVRTNNLDRFEVSATEDETGADGQWAVTAIAICADPIPGLEIITQANAPQSTARDTAVARCPEGKSLMGGGGRINSGQGQVHLRSANSTAFLFLVADGWEDETGFAGNWSVTGYAVCAPNLSDLRRASDASEVDSTDRKVVEAECTDGRRVVGAAFRITDDNPNVVLESIAPNALPGGVPGTRLRAVARENNPLNDTWRVEVVAFCHG